MIQTTSFLKRRYAKVYANVLSADLISLGRTSSCFSEYDFSSEGLQVLHCKVLDMILLCTGTHQKKAQNLHRPAQAVFVLCGN
jgi:hypothetical protein